MTWFQCACKTGNYLFASVLLAIGVSDTYPPLELKPLILALKGRHRQVLRLLLEHKYTIDYESRRFLFFLGSNRAGDILVGIKGARLLHTDVLLANLAISNHALSIRIR